MKQKTLRYLAKKIGVAPSEIASVVWHNDVFILRESTQSLRHIHIDIDTISGHFIELQPGDTLFSHILSACQLSGEAMKEETMVLYQKQA